MNCVYNRTSGEVDTTTLIPVMLRIRDTQGILHEGFDLPKHGGENTRAWYEWVSVAGVLGGVTPWQGPFSRRSRTPTPRPGRVKGAVSGARDTGNVGQAGQGKGGESDEVAVASGRNKAKVITVGRANLTAHSTREKYHGPGLHVANGLLDITWV